MHRPRLDVLKLSRQLCHRRDLCLIMNVHVMTAKVLLCGLGLLCMLSAIFAGRFADALSIGPYRPIPRTGRVFIFIVGLGTFFVGLQLFLSR
jgi:hypothetical protein